MNCDCGKPAVLKTVQKEGPNKGKEFFTCSSGDCKFFKWQTNGRMPATVTNNYKASTTRPNNTSSKGIPELKFEVFNYDKDESGVNTTNDGAKVIWISIISPFIYQVTEYLKTLPNNKCHYLEAYRIWIFDFNIYETIVAALNKFPDAVKVLELPEVVKVALMYYEKIMNEIAYIPTEPCLAPELKDQLKPFQLEGIRFVISRRGRALIGDDMGLGNEASLFT
jgi:hypothetical protein